MTTSNFLTLEPATLEDIPSLTELWYEAFTEPATRHIWPDTPGVRQWWNEATRCDMLNKPCALYVKIVDPQAPDAHGRPRIVAFAKWDLAMPKERGRRWPPWHADQPGRECEAFLETLERNRRRVMGESKHYYLDMLGTHPDYRRRGAGAMLVKWGCDLADQHGLGVYVDASKSGAPLYARFGFVDESEPGSGDVAPMARRQLC